MLSIHATRISGCVIRFENIQKLHYHIDAWPLPMTKARLDYDATLDGYVFFDDPAGAKFQMYRR